jgi:hypothetical protein
MVKVTHWPLYLRKKNPDLRAGLDVLEKKILL